MNATLAAEISRLSIAEKILLVEEIWDQVAADSGTVAVPAAHRAELDKRLAADSGDAGLPWAETALRRSAELDSGKAELIPGDVASARIRKIVGR